MSSLERFLGGGLVLDGFTSSVSTPVQELPPDYGAGWPEQIRHLSATSIGMFRRCPEQFRHRYILGEKERPGEALVVGSAFHEGLEFNYAQKISTHVDRPLDEVVEYLQDEAVPKVIEEAGGAEEIAWDVGDYHKGVQTLRKDSERMLVRYHSDVVPRIQPLALEEEFYLHDPSLIVPLLAYVDLRTGYEDGASAWIVDRIIDTKTGKQSSSKLKPSWMLQATLYSAMTDLRVEYHSISRAATPKIVTALESPEMVFEPNPIKARNVIATAATVAEMIAWLYQTRGPDETWPTMGRFADFTMSFSPCTNCGWRSVCPAMAGEA
jgi:PD-(D/E)XK nuclease superfamily